MIHRNQHTSKQIFDLTSFTTQHTERKKKPWNPQDLLLRKNRAKLRLHRSPSLPRLPDVDDMFGPKKVAEKSHGTEIVTVMNFSDK